jgi:hypothetical protein
MNTEGQNLCATDALSALCVFFQLLPDLHMQAGSCLLACASQVIIPVLQHKNAQCK